MIKHLELEIYNRGEDPFFTRTMKHRAGTLGIHGYIESRDSYLFAELEGEEESLIQFLKEYEQGDEAKDIIRLESEYKDEYKGFDTFEIK